MKEVYNVRDYMVSSGTRLSTPAHRMMTWSPQDSRMQKLVQTEVWLPRGTSLHVHSGFVSYDMDSGTGNILQRRLGDTCRIDTK